MKHYIIVKFSESVEDKTHLCKEIKALFRRAEKIEGIHAVSFYSSAIDLPNRYDFMILMDLEREALPVFDASPIHRDWKEGYARHLAAKTIFDCE